MTTRQERSEIRRENLKRYCIKYLGGPHTDRAVLKALKEKTGHAGSSYVNDLLAEGSRKGIAEEAAQRFEDKLQLIDGQLSEPNSKLLLDPRKLDTAKKRLEEMIQPLSNEEAVRVMEFISRLSKPRHA